MRRPSVASLFLRGVKWGLLVTLVNGLSLPVLFGLFIRLLTALEKGKWPSGPVSVAELWVIHFVFGVVCSFLPSVVGTVLLGLGMRGMWPEKVCKKRSVKCAGVALGVVVTACYAFLLFYLEPVLNMQEHGLLTLLILVEQVTIYVWLANRWFPDQSN